MLIGFSSNFITRYNLWYIFSCDVPTLRRATMDVHNFSHLVVRRPISHTWLYGDATRRFIHFSRFLVPLQSYKQFTYVLFSLSLCSFCFPLGYCTVFSGTILLFYFSIIEAIMLVWGLRYGHRRRRYSSSSK